MSFVASALALLLFALSNTLEVLAKSLSDESGPIGFRLSHSAIGISKQLLLKDYLDRLHIYILLHSGFHTLKLWLSQGPNDSPHKFSQRRRQATQAAESGCNCGLRKFPSYQLSTSRRAAEDAKGPQRITQNQRVITTFCSV